MPFMDFDALKKAITFEQAIGLLGLQVKRHSGTQWRGACPACKTGGDRALVITEGKGFFCFTQRAGGGRHRPGRPCSGLLGKGRRSFYGWNSTRE